MRKHKTIKALQPASVMICCMPVARYKSPSSLNTGGLGSVRGSISWTSWPARLVTPVNLLSTVTLPELCLQFHSLTVFPAEWNFKKNHQISGQHYFFSRLSEGIAATLTHYPFLRYKVVLYESNFSQISHHRNIRDVKDEAARQEDKRKPSDEVHRYGEGGREVGWCGTGGC